MDEERLRQIIREEHGKLLDAFATMFDAAKPRKAKKPAEFVDAQEMVEAGVSMRHAAEWLATRKAKNLPLTRTAWEQTQEEAQKAGLSIGDAIKASCANGWAGFRAQWLKPKERDERGEHSQKQAAVVSPMIEQSRQLLASQELPPEQIAANVETARRIREERGIRRVA